MKKILILFSFISNHPGAFSQTNSITTSGTFVISITQEKNCVQLQKLSQLLTVRSFPIICPVKQLISTGAPEDDISFGLPFNVCNSVPGINKISPIKQPDK